MAMIKCKECSKDMSDRAKSCPHCGCENSIMFCPECDKKLSSKASLCPNCGYAFKTLSNTNNNDKGENYNMAVAALICSFFIAIVGLILGIIVLNANKGKTNTARTMGLISVIISGAFLFISFLWIVDYLTYWKVI